MNQKIKYSIIGSCIIIFLLYAILLSGATQVVSRTTFDLEKTPIENIEINVSDTNIKLISTAESEILVNTSQNTRSLKSNIFNIFVDGKTLNVSDYHVSQKKDRFDNQTVEIYIPNTIKLEDIDLKVDDSQISFLEIEAKNVDLVGDIVGLSTIKTTVENYNVSTGSLVSIFEESFGKNLNLKTKALKLKYTKNRFDNVTFDVTANSQISFIEDQTKNFELRGNTNKVYIDFVFEPTSSYQFATNQKNVGGTLPLQTNGNGYYYTSTQADSQEFKYNLQDSNITEINDISQSTFGLFFEKITNVFK